MQSIVSLGITLFDFTTANSIVFRLVIQCPLELRRRMTQITCALTQVFFAHSLTQPLTHSPTLPLTLSPNHSLTHPLTHSLSHSLYHSLSHSRTPSLTHSPTYLVELRRGRGCEITGGREVVLFGQLKLSSSASWGKLIEPRPVTGSHPTATQWRQKMQMGITRKIIEACGLFCMTNHDNRIKILIVDRMSMYK